MSATVSIGTVRAFVEGYPEGGRIPRHSHAMDQLALITQSAAVIETDTVYVVHPLLKASWLPAGVEHSVYSPRPFALGYDSPAAFSTAFKQCFGVSPSNYLSD